MKWNVSSASVSWHVLDHFRAQDFGDFPDWKFAHASRNLRHTLSVLGRVICPNQRVRRISWPSTSRADIDSLTEAAQP